MKEMTKYSRVAGYLEKLFDMLNADLFDGELDRPIITLIPSSRSYGHYVPTPIWSIKDDCKHGLNVTRSDKYGYSHTSPSDRLLEWCMTHDLREIELCRMDIERGSASGSRAVGGSATVRRTASHNHRFVCPKCGAVARAGRSLNLVCGDCVRPMLETA